MRPAPCLRIAHLPLPRRLQARISLFFSPFPSVSISSSTSFLAPTPSPHVPITFPFALLARVLRSFSTPYPSPSLAPPCSSSRAFLCSSRAGPSSSRGPLAPLPPRCSFVPFMGKHFLLPFSLRTSMCSASLLAPPCAASPRLASLRILPLCLKGLSAQGTRAPAQTERGGG
jgi:hypothetical protein